MRATNIENDWLDFIVMRHIVRGQKLFLWFLLCIILIFSEGCSSAKTQQTVPTSSPSAKPTPIVSIEERIKDLEQQVKKLESKPKDVWDKISATSSLISGGLVAAIGIFATYLYNERQRKNSEEQKQREIAVLQVQTVQGFMPQLQSGQAKEIEAALLAIAALGNAKLATELAAIYRTEGAISALSKIALNPNPEIAERAKKSLEDLFNLLKEAVVSVGSDSKPRGSGFFISHDGFIITPGFVIENPDNIHINFRGTQYQAHLVSPYDKDNLILLKIDGSDFPALRISKKVEVDSGDEVFLLGFEPDRRIWSFISGEIEGFSLRDTGDLYIKARLDIKPGYAGAPVINRRNEVIGVVFMRDQVYAYLVPVEVILKFIERYLSIEVEPTGH